MDAGKFSFPIIVCFKVWKVQENSWGGGGGGGGGGREGMPLKTLTFLFTEKKKNQKLCVLKKK